METPLCNTPYIPAKPAFSSALLSLSIVFFLGFSSPLAAQQFPAALDPGQLLKQGQGNSFPEVQQADEELLIPPAQAPSSGKALPVDAAGKVMIQDITFTGAVSYPQTRLKEIVQARLGRELSFNEIQALANDVAQFYRREGFFLAQVLVPAQDISDGNLEFRVLEGKLSQRASKVTVTGNEQISEKRIAGTLLAQLEQSESLKESDLVRGILVVNDLPGIKASVTIEPGEEPGTSRLVAAVTEGRRLRGALSLDNAGNRYTGALRTGLNLFADNLSGQGDQASFQTSRSVHGDFEYYRLAYARPVGYRGLTLGVAASNVDYASGKELTNLEALGKARAVTLNAQYPLIRSRSTNFYLTSTLENRRVESQTLGLPVTDKVFDVFSFGINADHAHEMLGSGISTAGLSLTYGRLDLDRLPGALSADQAEAGLKTQGGYAKLNFNLTRLQSLSQTAVAQVSLSGQYAQQNLDSGEKFALGGPSGVKSYPSGEALGDRGLVLSVELRSTLAKNVEFAGIRVGDIQASIFHDVGKISQFDMAPDSLSSPRKYSLRDVGFGLNLGDAGRYDFRVMVAHSLGGNVGVNAMGNDSDGRNSKTRLVIFTTVYF